MLGWLEVGNCSFKIGGIVWDLIYFLYLLYWEVHDFL